MDEPQAVLPKRVFAFEYLTGGGLFCDGLTPADSPSLVAEGTAMRDALVLDLLAAGADVAYLHDERLTLPAWAAQPRLHRFEVANREDFSSRFAAAAQDSQFGWLIAPEFDGTLLKLVERASSLVPLVSPASDLVALGSDKHATAIHLQKHAVPAPQGYLWQRVTPIEAVEPTVVKPNNGAGSVGMRLLTPGECLAPLADDLLPGDYRVERWISGPAFSVAIIGGRDGFVVLEPCEQRISVEQHFAYLGGRTPVQASASGDCPGEDNRRALCELAAKAARALPRWHGFIGVDIVFGEDGPVVIEVNPRLTTSYVALRQLFRENLAKIILESDYQPTRPLSVKNFQLQFDPDGQLVVEERSAPFPLDSTGAERFPERYPWQPWIEPTST
jgi:predicted ATP-grasp superfamily ATP-dependent carboligase